jgi:hypothetical protein
MSAAKRPDAGRLYTGRFTAFADMLLLGVLVTLGSLPVVTWFVALAAGADLMRQRETHDVTIGVRTYASRWTAALRTGWAGVVVPTAGLLVLAIDVFAVGAGLDQPQVVVPLTAAAVVAGALALRCAAAWYAGRTWRACVEDALREAREDVPGTVLLTGAILVAGLLVAWVPPIGVIVPGLLALAGAALGLRGRAPTRAVTPIAGSGQNRQP